jgi:glycosyltransferase involved in cell wall biosynthesis
VKLKGINVCHLTSVHVRKDTRVFRKECVSLANNGANLTLVVGDGKGNEEESGVRIVDLGNEPSKFSRMRKSFFKFYKYAMTLNADIYHIHDPELIPCGLLLSLKGKKVIYDSHEDVSVQILSKNYLTPFILKVISFCYRFLEKFAFKRIEGVITATDFILEKNKPFTKNIQTIFNYPSFKEMKLDVDVLKENKVCYIGDITRVRGIKEDVEAFEFVKSDCYFDLAGPFAHKSFYEEVKALPSWERVKERGFMKRELVGEFLLSSKAGVCTLYKTKNYLDALPVKMFEYMAASIPVIISDIPLWKSIVDKYNCGLTVDPKSPKQIAEAIDWIMNNEEEAVEMGKRGQKAVEFDMNWENEEKKLVDFYLMLLN